MQALREIATITLLPAVLLAVCVQGAWAAPEAARHAGKPASARQEVLIPLQAITGGRLAVRLDANGFPLPDALQGFTSLIFPSALAVRGTDLYIADIGARKVYRFDIALQVLSVVPDVVAMPWTRLQVGADQSLFVLDAGRSVILRYGRGGQALQTLADPLITARLSEFALDEPFDQIVASDPLNQRLVVIRPLGQTARPLTLRPVAPGALTVASRRVYALDMGCACIAVMNEEGQVLDHIGQGMLTQPRALAIDRHEYIFVIDGADRTLKIFLHGDLAAAYPAHALGMTEISALAMDEGTLYLADGPGSRVLSFRIQPPAKD